MPELQFRSCLVGSESWTLSVGSVSFSSWDTTTYS